jgi:two-component system chemotaxis response regulator CheB
LLNGRRIRVLVVDDSAVVRRILADSLSAERDIEVVGTAPDPVVARDKIQALKPDVLTLDIEMPRMDGLTFLRMLMAEHPMPVIVISSLAASGCATALRAIELGAVEVLGKPAGPYSIGDLRLVLAQKIRSAARAKVGVPLQGAAPPKGLNVARSASPETLIVVGASTGGTEAIRALLEPLPAEMPPIAVVQHIPPVFSRAFADRLDTLTALSVKEASDGDRLSPGTVLIAPGDLHMMVQRSGGVYRTVVKTGPRICYQRPAVDLLFRSAAAAAGRRVIAVLLTGMGSDGAEGMLEVLRGGGRTVAQDERSCVVYGMLKRPCGWEQPRRFCRCATYPRDSANL